jgi:hypothetical protein
MTLETNLLVESPLAITPEFPQTLSINPASTSSPGAVRLEDSINCNSTLLAATANAVRVVNNQATSAYLSASTALASAELAQSTASARIPCSCFIASGTLLAGTGPSTFAAVPPGPIGSVLSRDNTCVGGMGWVSGASGTFVSQDGKTITVTNGLITSIV